MQVSCEWHGLAFVPTVQLVTIFGVPELLFTQAYVCARAADEAIPVKPSAKTAVINVLIDVLI